MLTVFMAQTSLPTKKVFEKVGALQ
jgi:hypothetical protein